MLSQLGDAAAPAALSLAVVQHSESAYSLALVLICATVPKVLLLPVGGVVVDRFNARHIAIFTDMIRSAAQFCIGIELLGGTPQIWALCLTQIVAGSATAFASPTKSPLVTGVVPAGELMKANSLLGVVGGAALIGGPAIAGVFVLTVGSGWVLILDAATFAASAVILMFIEIKVVAVPRRSFWSDLAEGWSHVRSRDWYLFSLILHSVVNGASSVFLVLGPEISVAKLGGERSWVAAMEAGAIGLIVGSTLAMRIRPRRPLLVANLSLTMYSLPLAMLAATAPAFWLVFSYGVSMVGLGILNTIWATTVQTEFPPGVLARVTSYDWLVSFASMPLGYLVAPLAATAWGTTLPLVASAILVSLSALLTALVPGVRRFTGDSISSPVA